MANTPDVTECAACRRQGDARLPIDPWRSLAVHFGMLLGVEDFKTVDAYHRGKMWLHAAWLHREGVIWGLEPIVVQDRGELKITAGLALDACGRELHLDRNACIDLGKWFSARADKLLAEIGTTPPAGSTPIRGTDRDVAAPAVPAAAAAPVAVTGSPDDVAPPVVPDGGLPKPKPKPSHVAPEAATGPVWTDDGKVRLDAHVRIRFVGCLERQVPALVEPCDGAGHTTAYSRVYETVELELVDGLPEPSSEPYPRLRMLFGLDPVTDTEVEDAREAIAALPLAEQPAALEQAFRRFAALDAAKLQPATDTDGTSRSLLPAVDPAWLTLAELHGLIIRPDGDRWVFDELEQLQWDQRPTHVATRPLEDLVAAALAIPSSAAGPVGPRIVRSSVEIQASVVRFATDAAIDPLSLASASIELHAFDPASGWQTIAVNNPSVATGGKKVKAEHAGIPSAATRVRLIVDGSSGAPVLGVDGWPLAGADDDPPCPAHAGRDFAHIERLGE